jgi:hypothetical protein
MASADINECHGGDTRNMSARIKFFLLCSMLMHAAAAWALLWNSAAEQGTARTSTSKISVSAITAVRLAGPTMVPESSLQQLSSLRLQEVAGPENDQNAASETSSRQAPLAEQPALADATDMSDYLPVGRLTRLPVPIGEIDLNVPDISAAAVGGELILTIMINADGTVAAVESTIESEDGRVFAQRVTERFKHARFAPGEIDGAAVKSQLRIVVVGEEMPTGVDRGGASTVFEDISPTTMIQATKIQ